jgi:hypothetical protein
VCHTEYAEDWPPTCEGCGQPYVRDLVHVGHSTQPWARALTCERPGCGVAWIMPEGWPLRPVLVRCRDRRCPTWRTTPPPAPPFPAAT